ncbi:MAG: metallophosphoesterase [Oscillospiraceae bacterium]|nr:metallophosphoesterase [Oscillospiraceae bacterium]
MIVLMQRCLALFLALIFSIGVPTPTQTHDVKDKDECLMSFSVLSDVHVEMNNNTTRKRFVSVLYDVKNAETENDALVFLGDNTMNGQVGENLVFNGLIDLVDPAKAVYTAMGNHDTGNGNGEDNYRRRAAYFWNCFNDFNGTNVKAPYYYAQEFDNCVFAFMASEADASNFPTISKEQVQWLDGVLAKTDEAGVPAFVFNHHPLKYIDENGAALLETLMRHHNVFFINGHDHDSFLDIGNFDPDTHYIVVPKCTDLPEEGMQDDTGAGLQIEIYDGEVLVRARRFCTSEWLGEYSFSIK